MEISKMLTISTAHITPDTRDALMRTSDSAWFSNNVYEHNIPFAVYKKETFGFFVYLTEDALDNALTGELCPRDLLQVAVFAAEHECDVLCLDGDGEILPELPNYSELY